MPLTEGYPHPELLETPEWLAAHLDDTRLKVLDARSATDYGEGHIPGAILLPSPVFKAEGSPETCSADEFAKLAGGLGVRPSDTVVCYDAQGTGAARAWWAFTHFGHAPVRFLHGGWKAWQAGGYPIEMKPSTYPPVDYHQAHPEAGLACSLPQAVDALKQGEVLFWDTRTADEFSGADPRSNPADRVGHIPRAVHLEWSDLTDTATGLFKPADEMRRILSAKGITPEKEVVTY